MATLLLPSSLLKTRLAIMSFFSCSMLKANDKHLMLDYFSFIYPIPNHCSDWVKANLQKRQRIAQSVLAVVSSCKWYCPVSAILPRSKVKGPVLLCSCMFVAWRLSWSSYQKLHCRSPRAGVVVQSSWSVIPVIQVCASPGQHLPFYKLLKAWSVIGFEYRRPWHHVYGAWQERILHMQIWSQQKALWLQYVYQVGPPDGEVLTSFAGVRDMYAQGGYRHVAFEPMYLSLLDGRFERLELMCKLLQKWACVIQHLGLWSKEYKSLYRSVLHLFSVCACILHFVLIWPHLLHLDNHLLVIKSLWWSLLKCETERKHKLDGRCTMRN